MDTTPLPSPTTLPQRVATAANVYYTPILVGLGTIGNILAIYVLLRSKLRNQSTVVYLSALAVSDTVFLQLLIPPWLGLVAACDVFRRNGFCQVFEYLSYVSCCASAWLVAGFTIERFVAVVYPLRRAAWCTVQRARLMVAAAVGLALAANAPVLWFAGIVNGDCGIDLHLMHHATYFNASDTIVAFSAPMFVIAVLNMIIMCKVRHSCCSTPQPLPPLPQRQSAQTKITRMLLIVSTVFVLLNLPAYIMRIMAYATDAMKDKRGILQAMQQVSQMLFNTNFGINFILYCVTGQYFRRAFFMSVPCVRRRMQHAAAARAISPHTNRNNSISTSAVSAVTESGAVHAGASPQPSCSVLRRWRFDNSRQYAARQAALEAFEMKELSTALPGSPAPAI